MGRAARVLAGILVPLGLAFGGLSVEGGEARPSLRGTPYQEDFEDGLAQGWNLDPGWHVAMDGGNNVLAGQGHVWSRADQHFEGDLRQSFRVKLIQGRIHLVIRLTDAARYFIGFDSAGSDLNKQYFPNEFHNGLAGRSDPNSLNRWYELEIVLQGRTIKFLRDRTEQWSYTDAQPLTTGSFAFETLNDSQAYVDNIAVESTMGQAPALPYAPTIAAPVPPAFQGTTRTWVRTGGPLGGLGYDIRMRPDNPDRMFVTDAWAGIFASTDGGATWFPSSDGISTRAGPSGDAIPVFSLTIDPNNPNLIWAGTQFQRGIFKSLDGGQTWNKMDRGIEESEGVTFRGFTVEPGDSETVYAAAEVSSWAWTPNRQERRGREFDLTRGVVYKTTNGGKSWNPIWRGDNLARYVWINPENTDVLYISTGFFDREAANSDPVRRLAGGEGILKSIDGGSTWQAVNNGLENLYFTSLFMNPNDPDTLLAAAGNNQYREGGGVYLTTDGGASWTRTLTAPNSVFECVEFATSDPSIAYAGSDSEVYRSEDGGQTWTRVSGGEYWGAPGVRAGFPIDFQIDPRNPDRIFANEYGGGNFLSVDGGRTWADASRGYTGAQVRDIAVDQTGSGPVIAAARSGIFASYDGGADWAGLAYPPAAALEWHSIAFDLQQPEHLLAATNWYGMLASYDGGQAWRIVAPMISEHIGWRAIAFAPSDPSIVYAGTAGYYSAGQFDPEVPGKGIYRSQDGGRTWAPANDSLSEDAHVAALGIDPSNPQIAFAATLNRGVLQTTDGGREWRSTGDWTQALSVAINPTDSSIIFAGLDRGGIYRSLDGGQAWQRASSGISPESSVTDIVFDPTNPAEVLYAAVQQSGVYRSVDRGTTWVAISDGLLSRAVNALAITSDGLHLYAATEGSGAFRLDLNGKPPLSVAAPAEDATTSPYQYSGAAEASAPPTATQYQYRFGTPSPSASSTERPPLCGRALVPIGLTVVVLVWKRGRFSARS